MNINPSKVVATIPSHFSLSTIKEEERVNILGLIRKRDNNKKKISSIIEEIKNIYLVVKIISF